MHLENTILIDAPADIIFRLAADVPRWPELLPHYRSVRVLERRGGRLLVRMAAHRDGIPVSWTSILEPRPAEGRVLFRHVRGVTRGMDVTWHIRPTASGGGSDVSIEHAFRRPLPLLGEDLLPAVIDRFFVRPIAGRTLAAFKALAERGRAA